MGTARRTFLKLAASMLCVRGASAQTPFLRDLPTFDGELAYDRETREAAANDWGREIHRPPAAVLKPTSATDVARLVTYANKNHLKIAMRGQGHSVCGQAQVLSGIVIDSSTLNSVRWQGKDQLDAQPGAQWDSVARTALQQSRTPPVMPDALMLTVGGTLSAGGTGETSCRFGAQVDHVLELDVVTGRGDLVTCSPSRNEELFHMVLAGLGQCGIIVRARLRLVDAPKYVLRRTSTYGDSDALVGEAARVANAGAVPMLGGEITKDSDGRWRMALVVGTFSDEPSLPYWDYLDRRTASVAATKAKGIPNPSLALVLPERSVQSFLSSVLSDPEAAAGIWRIELLPMITVYFKQPLHVLPEGTLVFTVRLQRRASAENAPDHKAMVLVNRALAQRCIAAGGKIYPPHAPVLSRQQWQQHYGAQTWQRFAVAKRRFDPNNVLTPGAGVFGVGL